MKWVDIFEMSLNLDTNRYLGSRRYLGEKDALIINLKQVDDQQ